MRPRHWLLGLALCGSVIASPQLAQSLLEKGKPREALVVLRNDLVRHPNNRVAKYNYAVGAYASGIYSSAIETLTTLAASPDPETAVRSQFQLGNANFRLAEQMREANRLGSAVRFEEAVKRYDYAATQPGGFQTLAQANLALAHTKAAEDYHAVARGKVAEGDRGARIKPEDAFLGWESSLEFFDKAMKHASTDTSMRQEKQAIVDRLAKELHLAGGRLLRQGQALERTAPERAIELFRQAIPLYERSAGHGNESGPGGSADAKASLGRALLNYTTKLRTTAETELTRSAAAALEALTKAQANLTEAENLGGDVARVGEEKAHLSELWPKAHIARGDEQVEEAARASTEGKTPEQTRSLLGALRSYEQALRYTPEDSATQQKRTNLLAELTLIYTAEGQRHLHLAKDRMDQQIEEALASAEKSVQSFRMALEFDKTNELARAGLTEAQRVLEEIKARIKEDQRRSAEKSKDEMKESKDLKDLPKDLALKLLDYRNNNPAMKNPQLLTAPENRPRQDW